MKSMEKRESDATMTTKRDAGGPVSLADIAKAADVSISTVSRVVNGQTHRASAETAERVRRAIEELGYRPNQIGRTLKKGKSRVVAMLTAGMHNPVMSTIASSTEAALRDAGYVMFLCDTHDRAELQDEYLNAMRAQAVEGYILVTNIKSPGLAEFVERGEPMVFACRRNPYRFGPFVGIDDKRAGAAAADRLWADGCRRTAAILPTGSSQVLRERVEGFRARLAEVGAEPPAIVEAGVPGGSLLEIGYEAARRLEEMNIHPDGILCASDQLAYGAHRRATERGLRVPGDRRLISIDGSELNGWIAPWLVSIHVPYREYGTHIVEQLLSLWHGRTPREILLPFLRG